ncbi:MAG: threonine-phosphate decarboxylase CobD [Pseudomonadota bacterium]
MAAELMHGGALQPIQAQFSAAPQPWIDLSTGVNPWPYPMATTDGDYTQLPEPGDLQQLREAAASAFAVAPQRLLAGPGSELLMRLLPAVVSAHHVGLARVGYGDYRAIWQQAGALITSAEDVLETAGRVDLMMLGNPNNPDGRQYTPDQLLNALHELQQRQGWLVVDEAYGELYPELSILAAAGQPGLIVFRSFGKFYGLPGLRLGWVMAPPDILQRYAAYLGVWPVHSAALNVATQAYHDRNWQQQTRHTLSAAGFRLTELLVAHNLEIIGATDLFCLVRADSADRLWHELAEAGIYVRHFAEHPGCLRFGLPAAETGWERLHNVLNRHRSSWVARP